MHKWRVKPSGTIGPMVAGIIEREFTEMGFTLTRRLNTGSIVVAHTSRFAVTLYRLKHNSSNSLLIIDEVFDE